MSSITPCLKEIGSDGSEPKSLFKVYVINFYYIYFFSFFGAGGGGGGGGGGIPCCKIMYVKFIPLHTNHANCILHAVKKKKKSKTRRSWWPTKFNPNQIRNLQENEQRKFLFLTQL